jgi:hypothetical protein
METVAALILMLSLSIFSLEVNARCGGPRKTEFQGTFEIVNLEPAFFLCHYDENMKLVQPSTRFSMDGCFVDVKTSKGRVLKIYDDGPSCSHKTGDKISVHTFDGNSCCDRKIFLELKCRTQPKVDLISGPKTREDIACLSGRDLLLPN